LYSFYKRSFTSTGQSLGQGIAVEQLWPFGPYNVAVIDQHIVNEPGFPISA